jgi:hypothetical protein
MTSSTVNTLCAFGDFKYVIVDKLHQFDLDSHLTAILSKVLSILHDTSNVRRLAGTRIYMDFELQQAVARCDITDSSRVPSLINPSMKDCVTDVTSCLNTYGKCRLLHAIDQLAKVSHQFDLGIFQDAFDMLYNTQHVKNSKSASLEEAIDECGIHAPSEIWRLIDGDMDPELSAVLLCLNGCGKSMLHEQLRRLRQELDIRKSALCTNTKVQVPISTAVDSGSTFGNIQSVLEARNIQSVSEATNIQSGCEVPETFTTGHEVPANSTNGSCEFPNTSTTGRSPKTSISMGCEVPETFTTGHEVPANSTNGSCEFPNTSTTGRSPKTSTTGQGVPENSTKAGSEFPETSIFSVPTIVPFGEVVSVYEIPNTLRGTGQSTSTTGQEVPENSTH